MSDSHETEGHIVLRMIAHLAPRPPRPPPASVRHLRLKAMFMGIYGFKAQHLLAGIALTWQPFRAARSLYGNLYIFAHYLL